MRWLAAGAAGSLAAACSCCGAPQLGAASGAGAGLGGAGWTGASVRAGAWTCCCGAAGAGACASGSTTGAEAADGCGATGSWTCSSGSAVSCTARFWNESVVLCGCNGVLETGRGIFGVPTSAWRALSPAVMRGFGATGGPPKLRGALGWRGSGDAAAWAAGAGCSIVSRGCAVSGWRCGSRCAAGSGE